MTKLSIPILMALVVGSIWLVSLMPGEPASTTIATKEPGVSLHKTPSPQHTANQIPESQSSVVETENPYRLIDKFKTDSSSAARVNLENLLHHQERMVTVEALAALGERGDSAAMEAIIPFLDHHEVLIHRGAAMALGQIAQVSQSHARDRIAEVLIATYRNFIPRETSDQLGSQFVILEALGKSRGDRSYEFLIDLLHEEDPILLSVVVQALLDQNNPEAMDPLEDLLATLEERPLSQSEHETLAVADLKSIVSRAIKILGTT